ncbi:reverse transcriptase domain-containing protein [Tanacetum coccineum]
MPKTPQRFHGLVQIRKFTHKGSSSGSTYLSFYAWSWSSETRQKVNNKIPKTVDEMFERVRAFIRGEVAAGSAEMGQGSQHQRLLSVKKANRGRCGLEEVGPSGERSLPEQPEEQEPRKEQCKGEEDVNREMITSQLQGKLWLYDEETPDVNEGGTFNLSKKLQAKSTPTPRAWRLYMGKETIKEGTGVGIILVSPDEKIHSYAIRLKFNAFDRVIDCEALLAGLAASISKGMKDLHVFMDSPQLVAQIEGNYTPATEQEKRYKKEIMDATALFHRFWITHLPKNLNSKEEVLTGLATIKLEFLNQEVSVGIKTRPSVEETSNNKKGKVASNVPGGKRTKPN